MFFSALAGPPAGLLPTEVPWEPVLLLLVSSALAVLLFVPRAYGVLLPAAKFYFSLLLLLSLARLGFSLWKYERVAAVDGWDDLALLGLRMDLIAVSLFVAPIVLLDLVAGGKHLVGRLVARLQHVYLVAGALLFLFLETATPPFIAEYDTRPNRLFIEYLVHPREVSSMLIKGYKFELFVGAIVSLAVVAVAWKLVGGWSKDLRRTGLAHRMGLALVLLPLLFLAIRSSLQHRGANISTAVFCGDHLVNTLGVSSAYSVAYAAYQIKDEADAGDVYGTMDDATLFAEVRQQMRTVAPEDFLSDELPTLHRQRASVRRERPLNLIIVLEESLGAQYVSELGGQDLTPRLSSYAERGWWFDRLYATGTRSVRGIEAVVAGFPPTPARAVVKLGKAQTGFFTLAQLLGEQGYRTQFIYGGEGHFDNMESFFTGNGFQEVIDQQDFVDPVFVGSWGVSDEDIFNRAHESFLNAGDQPFFSLVFSVSNHSPYEFPDGRIDLAGRAKAISENTVRYADYALGEFLDKALASEYGANSIILVVADHDSRVFGADLVPIRHFQIPGVIFGPKVPVQRDARITSQLDLGPTLLSLMGIDSVHPMIGRDLTRLPQSEPGRAIMQYGTIQAYRQGDDVIVFQPELEPSQHRIVPSAQGDPLEHALEPAPLDADLLRCALAHALLGSRLYDRRLFRLPKPGVLAPEF